MNYSEKILRKLMYQPKLRFSDMQLAELTSKHFNYYLGKLLEDKMISKDGKLYYLTDKGKEFIGRLDETDMSIEKQPKVSVAILVTRGEGEDLEVLLNRRLKQPYYGKVGGFTGKVRFGEGTEAAARRELLEETGLTGNFEFAGVQRKLAYKNGAGEQQFVQDQIMLLFRVHNPEGNLVKKRPENENFWFEFAKLNERDDLFNTFLQLLNYTLKHTSPNIDLIVEAEGY